MIIRRRAELDMDNPPGQVVNPIPRELTIGGIIDRIMKDEPKKLTFDEWFKEEGLDDHQWDVAKMAWRAAQENK